MEELSIKVTIANREYPLRINSTEEEAVRRAADIVNAKVKTLLDNYSVRDKQDLLAMCALQFATEMLKGNVSAASSAVNHSVQEMNDLLDQVLSGEEK